MFWLRFVNRLFKILNGETAPRQVAAGLAFGIIVGLTPTFSLHNLVVLFLICIIRVNVSMFIFSSILVGILSFLVNPVSHWLGILLLIDMGFLKPVWTALYNMPIIPLTGFNNTLLLGSLVISLAVFYPALLFGEKGIVHYRNFLKPKLDNTRLVRFIKKSKLYSWYAKRTGFGDIITK